jgi:putative ABC transport system permease protein
MTIPLFSSIYGLPLMAGFALLIGFIAGAYPAWFLASFHPVDVLRGGMTKGRRRSTLRSVLVVLQFSISIVLIIGTLVIRNQLSFIQNTNLGFTKEQVVVIKKTDDLGEQVQAFKQELLKYPHIISVSNCTELMGNPFELAAFIAEGTAGEETHLANYLGADADFLKTFQIELLEGRFFNVDRREGQVNVVLNETMVRTMGIEDPVGKHLINGIYTNVRYPIIGVVKDFHFESFHQRLRPLLLFSLQPREVGRYVSVRVRTEDIQETLSFMDQTWRRFTADQPFEYEFFDDHFSRIFLSEEKTAQIFLVFSVLAIIIASLGLFGLSAFITEQRTKEIGIRKVLGSSVPGILVLLIQQFSKWVLIANLVSWPVAYFVMRRWLENFAYRTSMGLHIFLISSALAFLIAVLTVSYQSIRAAFTNPVKSLRYE